MSSQLIPATALFRFSIPCRYHEQAGTLGLSLSDAHRLPQFTQLDGAPPLVELRAAWNENWLHFHLTMKHKKQRPWCHQNRVEDSDGLKLWIDTRNTHNIHRASRFCHQFVFLPLGGGQRLDVPLADQRLINRARENAQPIRPKMLQVASRIEKEGYELEALIPAAALTGFDVNEHSRLGFFWAVADREVGEIPLALTNEFPYHEDPSVWVTLELMRA